jgi:anti-sigma-K factor RskA
MTDGPVDPGLPDRDIEAAEYVLGTLPHAERLAFARALASDAALQAAVARWQTRLAPLDAVIPEVEPPAGLWLRIRAGLTPAVDDPRVTDLTRRLRRWRLGALGASALAAGLALALGLGRLLPTDPDAGQYVAVVNRGGELPALVVRVDTRRGLAEIRSVAMEMPREKSLELWYIADGGAPRSLGLVEPGRASMPMPNAVREAAGLDKAVLAVTVEPTGGAPGGVPTGPVVYSGKLFRD